MSIVTSNLHSYHFTLLCIEKLLYFLHLHLNFHIMQDRILQELLFYCFFDEYRHCLNQIMHGALEGVEYLKELENVI